MVEIELLSRPGNFFPPAKRIGEIYHLLISTISKMGPANWLSFVSAAASCGFFLLLLIAISLEFDNYPKIKDLNRAAGDITPNVNFINMLGSKFYSTSIIRFEFPVELLELSKV